MYDELSTLNNIGLNSLKLHFPSSLEAFPLGSDVVQIENNLLFHEAEFEATKMSNSPTTLIVEPGEHFAIFQGKLAENCVLPAPKPFVRGQTSDHSQYRIRRALANRALGPMCMF